MDLVVNFNSVISFILGSVDEELGSLELKVLDLAMDGAVEQGVSPEVHFLIDGKIQELRDFVIDSSKVQVGEWKLLHAFYPFDFVLATELAAGVHSIEDELLDRTG